MTFAGDDLVLVDLTAPRARVVAEVDRAARTHGFFHLVGHRAPPDHLDQVWTQTRRFFAQPRQEKLAISRTKDGSRGFYDRELTKRARDRKEVFDFAHVPDPSLPDDHPDNFAPVDGHNRWPEDLPGFREVMLRHLSECERIARELLGVFAEGLGLAPDVFDRHFGRDHTSFIRLNHYPLVDPLTAQGGHLRSVHIAGSPWAPTPWLAWSSSTAASTPTRTRGT